MFIKYLHQGKQPKLLSSLSFLLTCAVFLIIISNHSNTLFLYLLTGAFATAVIPKIGKQINLPQHKIRILQTLIFAAILSLFWLDYFADPAAAQFFGKAENFFKNTLTQGSQQTGTVAAISLVFNVLRALYLLYVAVALIGVINAVRKDEDWQVVARTPLLVVIAVTIADVLTSFITG
jgi:hypothetical protein